MVKPVGAKPVDAGQVAACCPTTANATAVDPLAADGELARLCKALGHPARVRILRRLAASGTCVFGSIARIVPLAPSTVAQHLASLEAAGLVRRWDDGVNSCYCVDRERLAMVTRLLDDLNLALD